MNLVDTVSHDTIQSDVFRVPPYHTERVTSLTGTENTRTPTGSAGFGEPSSVGTSSIGRSVLQEIRIYVRRFLENIGSDYPEETSGGPALPINQLVVENFVLDPKNILSRSKSDFEESPDLITQINDANNHEEIFKVLDLAEHQKIAQRLRYLHEITQDDDPEDPAMEFISLRKLALFFASDDVSLPEPEIGISPDGFLQAEWYPSNAVALMEFLPDDNIVFAATLTIDGQNRSHDVHGTGGKELALRTIRPFISRS